VDDEVERLVKKKTLDGFKVLSKHFAVWNNRNHEKKLLEQ